MERTRLRRKAVGEWAEERGRSGGASVQEYIASCVSHSMVAARPRGRYDQSESQHEEDGNDENGA